MSETTFIILLCLGAFVFYVLFQILLGLAICGIAIDSVNIINAIKKDSEPKP